MKAILLTGGAGYIGSHTAKLLSRAEFVPVVLDNLATGNSSAVKWGPLIRGDIRNQSLVSRILREYNISVVIHFAASAYVGESMLAPIEYFDNNVVASLSFLRALLESGVTSIVFSSSCATYGAPQGERFSEEHLQKPVNPYGESKLMIERALAWYGQAYGLRSVCLRYFNAAGADPEGEIGEMHDPETHLIPLAMRAILGQNSHLDVYGQDYDTPDGTAVRDYVHVNDISRAHILALKHLLEGGSSACLNLGTGRGYSVRQIIAGVESISGKALPARFVARRPGDPSCLIADHAAATALLGWRPECSDLDHIIKTAWAWHQNIGSGPAVHT